MRARRATSALPGAIGSAKLSAAQHKRLVKAWAACGPLVAFLHPKIEAELFGPSSDRYVSAYQAARDVARLLERLVTELELQSQV